ncbi:List-Bact-rpt repeat protein [Gammaproteobacteria bacterium]
MIQTISKQFWVWALWAILAWLGLTPWVQAGGLNDTGITTCSNATQNGLPCPVPGFPGQDAEYGTNKFDFTKLDASGNPLPASATNHTCVRDNVTGLMWEVKTADGGLRDQKWTYTWYDSSAPGGNPGTASGGTCHDTGRCDTGKFVQDVNAKGLCGFKDWRLPNPKELAGIVDYSTYDASIDRAAFPNAPSSNFWSSAPDAYYSDFAWYVSFSSGSANYGSRSSGFAVRLARGGIVPFASLFSNGDGTVTDNSTGLMWAQCSEGQSGSGCVGDASSMSWGDALTAAKNSRLGGYSDWRLPNIKELLSIVDYSVYGPSIDRAIFPNTPSSSFWSSAPHASTSVYAWIVSFFNGYARNYSRSSGFAVRLARGGAEPFVSLLLNVTKAGSGSGTVTSSPGGIDCGNTCGNNYAKYTSVTLTATPIGGSTFAGWAGDCTGTGTCTVSMTAARNVTATFNAPASETYTITASVSGTGRITSAPAGIDCGNGGSACSATFAEGSLVGFYATPGDGYKFSIWGDACGLYESQDTCTLYVSFNKPVAATFVPTTEPVKYDLSVSNRGAGSGTVTSSPSGINCGSTCSTRFDKDVSVTLYASTDSGSTFSGWSGDCFGAGNCTVSMTAARNVTATFYVIPPATFPLTVSTTGSGSGVVTSSPEGIHCGGSGCTENFSAGATVALTAEPSSGSTFGGWSGDCFGTSPCTLTMTGAKSVTANFVPSQPTTFTLSVNNPGGGTVTSSPPGISCQVPAHSPLRRVRR